jgi:acetyl esterase
MDDEGVLDPWVAEWMAANPMRSTPFDELVPELLELARGPMGEPPTTEIDHVVDDAVDDVPIRVYRHDAEATGLVVYFHGGGYCIGSIGLMDNVARAIAQESGATVVSVGYRLAPEHPFPAGLDDCEAVTRWAHAHADELGSSPSRVAVAGESAGGNLSATVSLRLQATDGPPLAGQVLLYPGVAGGRPFPSRDDFDGLILNHKGMETFWSAYSGDRNIDDDPFAAPLVAPDLRGLPPALVVLGGCDVLRDEGRAYAARLREADVAVDEVCYPGQPHGFMNFGFPAAIGAFERVGSWLRRAFADA